ncbi:MAG: RimJ/RimL family protein N-acetyltransferase [Verrucomicrobiales bacterium]|jgi:RimJ/RimL family protein N-acetyltransferase
MKIDLRPINAKDEPFLLNVFFSTKVEQMIASGWSLAEQEQFVEGQFRSQTLAYGREFPAAQFTIILADGEPVGRLSIDPRPDEIRILDFVLLEAFRGQGIGTKLITGLCEEFGLGRTVSGHIDRQSPAERLFERLGFERSIEADDTFLWIWRRSGLIV